MFKTNAGNIAMGILSICPGEMVTHRDQFYLAFFSISLSLNVLLTLMIVA